jgi:thiamine kinase-like enzyme
MRILNNLLRDFSILLEMLYSPVVDLVGIESTDNERIQRGITSKRLLKWPGRLIGLDDFSYMGSNGLESGMLRTINRKPSLTNMEGLNHIPPAKQIYLDHNSIEQLAGLENHPDLEQLTLDSNQISDLTSMPVYFRENCPGLVGKGVKIGLNNNPIVWSSRNRSALGELREMGFDIKVDVDYTIPDLGLDSLEEILVGQGINPYAAMVIKAEFGDLQECHPAKVASKNQVYHVDDKVVKLVSSKEEAEIEALVNREFSQHAVLRKYVAKGLVGSPIKVEMGGVTKYMIIQEDVSTNVKDPGLKYWLKAAAELQVYGTEIMNRLGNYHPALSLTKEKDEARVKDSGIIIDTDIRKDLREAGIENQLVFIHQDLRAANREGIKVIDWGHAGRGNPYLDVARILLDAQLQRDRPFTKEDYKQCISFFLGERNKALKIDSPTVEDVNRGYQEFKEISLLYAQAQSAYLVSKGDDCSVGERDNCEFLISQIRNIERELTSSGRISRRETDGAIVYRLPTITPMSSAA